MDLKILLSFLFFLLVVTLLGIYWFVPFDTTEFSGYITPENTNFSLNNSEGVLQFYENMRFPDSTISYKIHDCPEFKETQIKNSFDVIENLTILDFVVVQNGEDISAYCVERTKPSGDGFFIAGEGGPVNITRLENFNAIIHGEITLIKESKCDIPNVGIHEIFHALGFDHSQNPGSIMYNVSKCNQEIGEDLIAKINELYSYPPYADLSFENVTAVMNGKYLDTNISVRNNGFVKTENASVLIYADEDLVKEVELNSLDIGYGVTVKLTNVWVKQLNVDELKFEIKYLPEELEKTNNEIKLKIKK